MCRHRLEQTLKDGRFATREQAAQVQAIRAWGERTASGDRGEFADVPEDSPLWPRVTQPAPSKKHKDAI